MISIIVPVYNVEKYLGRCLDSIINQTKNDYELIIVNDGSTDGSYDICKDYAKRFSKVRVIDKENGGLSSARNAGLEIAKGEYVLFVDSDDYIAEDTIEILQGLIDKKTNTKNVDIVVFDAVEINGITTTHRRHDSLESRRIYSSRGFIIRSIDNNEFYAPVCFNAYKLSFLKENGLFFREGILHEDMDFLPKVFLAAKRILYVKKDLYNYVVREKSIMTTSNFAKKMRDMFIIYEEWINVIDDVDDRLLKRKLKGVLAKYYKASCRQNHFALRKYPTGINGFFLLSNCLNFTELLKTIYFLTFRKLYVMGSF